MADIRTSLVVDDHSLNELCETAGSGGLDLVTVDVFDTLVFRPVYEPADIYELVGDALHGRGMLAAHCGTEVFGALRATAEARTRRERGAEAGDSEISLYEIYRSLLPVLGGDVLPAAAAAVEVEVEREVVIPNLDVVAALHRVIEVGTPVVAVSDTYYSAEQLHSIFSQPHLDGLAFDRIVTSSDRRLNKAGGLLDQIATEMQVAPARLAHIGDSPESDIAPAERIHARTVFLPSRPGLLGEIVDAEQRFAEQRVKTLSTRYDGGLTYLRAQVLRSYEFHGTPAALSPYWEWGATVLGPVLCGFAEWIHNRMQALGEHRASCLMREGTFLSAVIAGAVDNFDRELDLRTLWLNRTVCSLAALTELDRESLTQIAGGRKTCTISDLLSRIGLTFGDVPNFVTHRDTRVDDPVAQAVLFETLINSDALRAKVMIYARKLRERVVRLVEREASGVARLVLVDLGWGASIQSLIARICREADLDIALHGLYLVTNEAARERTIGGLVTEGFLGESGLPDPIIRWFARSPEILEQACMSGDSPQLGLDDQLAPVLGDRLIPSLQVAEMRAAQRGVLAFQRHWNRYRAAVPSKLAPLTERTAALRSMLVRSVVAPTVRESAGFASWTHDEGGGSSALEHIAGPEQVSMARYATPTQLAAMPMSELYWPFGVTMIADPVNAELVALVNEGRLPVAALSSDTETGPFKMRAVNGINDDDRSSCMMEPRRNRSGLTLVRGTIEAHQITGLELEPGNTSLLARIDWLELRLWTPGTREPLSLRLDGTDDLRRLDLRGCQLATPNVIITYTGDATWTIDLRGLTESPIRRVELDAGLVLLPIPPITRSSQRIPAVAEIETMHTRVREAEVIVNSHSWRLTAPLRRLRHLRA